MTWSMKGRITDHPGGDRGHGIVVTCDADHCPAFEIVTTNQRPDEAIQRELQARGWGKTPDDPWSDLCPVHAKETQDA